MLAVVHSLTGEKWQSDSSGLSLSWEIWSKSTLPITINVLVLFHVKPSIAMWLYAVKGTCLCHPLSLFIKGLFVYTKWNLVPETIRSLAVQLLSRCPSAWWEKRVRYLSSKYSSITSFQCPLWAVPSSLFNVHNSCRSFTSLLHLYSSAPHLNNHITKTQLFLPHQYHCYYWARVAAWIPITVPSSLSVYEL